MPNHSIQLPFNCGEPDTSAFMLYPHSCDLFKHRGAGIAHCSVEHWNLWRHQSTHCHCAGAEAARPHAGDGAARRLPAEDRAARSRVPRAAARHRPQKHHARGDDLRREERHRDGAARVSVSRAARRPTTTCSTPPPSPCAPTCCCWASSTTPGPSLPRSPAFPGRVMCWRRSHFSRPSIRRCCRPIQGWRAPTKLPGMGRAMRRLARFVTRKWPEPDLRTAPRAGIADGRKSDLRRQALAQPGAGAVLARAGRGAKGLAGQTRSSPDFCFYDADAGNAALPAQLEEFLAAGEPPVVFTLGSAAVLAAGDFYEQSARAAKKLGVRAVLLIGDDPRNRPQQDSARFDLRGGVRALLGICFRARRWWCTRAAWAPPRNACAPAGPCSSCPTRTTSPTTRGA